MAAIKLGASKGKVIIGVGGSAAPTIPVYNGEYTVIPKVDEEQILETSGYAMAKDVTVKEIPYFEVKNTAGGTTATIG